MEASEATETTQAPEEATATETSEEQQAPDVGEALQQMSSRLEGIEQRLPQDDEDYDPVAALTRPLAEDEFGGQEEQGHEPQPESGEEEPDIRQLLGEVFDERLGEFQRSQQNVYNEQAIRAYAQENSEWFNDPKNVDALSAKMEELNLMPADGSSPPVGWVDLARTKLLADAAVSEAQQTSAEAGGEGATLETGAGPGVPEEQVDPATARWDKATEIQSNKDAFS